LADNISSNIDFGLVSIHPIIRICLNLYGEADLYAGRGGLTKNRNFEVPVF